MKNSIKKKILLFSLIAVCLSLAIGGTLAYFTATDTAENVITAGNIKIELIETDAEGNPFENVTDVLPGENIDKIVTVKNTSGKSCWVRISVEKDIILANNSEETPDLSLVGIDFNTENWTEKDGFYYYNEQLEAGETTEPLFTKVSFDKDMGNLYKGCTADVKVCAQAVQTANNGSTVLEANGWPEN